MNLDGKNITNDGDYCYIVAELCANHGGSADTCNAMITAAKQAGCDAVKLQKRSNVDLYTRAELDRPYKNENSYGSTYGEHRAALEFDRYQWEEIIAHAKQEGITLFSTAWDFKSADFLESLDMPMYKIASGDIRTVQLLKYVASFQKPMIVSTGAASLVDVERAYDAIAQINPRLALLHCVAGYPTPPSKLNLSFITKLKEAFCDVVVGYSSHFNGIVDGPLAYMHGARIIEKHFTLDRAGKGTDNAFSLTPGAMRRMVRDIRRVPQMMGDGNKVILDLERGPGAKMSKSVYAAHALATFATITPEDIALKSPGVYLPAYKADELVGRQTNKRIEVDEPITCEDINE